MDANKTCPCGAWRPRDDEWLSAMPLLTEERKNHAVTRQISEARLEMVRELKDECERLRHENKEQYDLDTRQLVAEYREMKAERDAARENVERVREPKLARHQPCGCVLCRCDDPYRCHGCGAKNCGTHPPGEFPQPTVYARYIQIGDVPDQPTTTTVYVPPCAECEQLRAELARVTFDLNRALLVLHQWIFVFDGQTEPLHPLSWQAELEATRRELEAQR